MQQTIEEQNAMIVKMLFDIDWMGTKEFCESHSYPVPVAVGSIQEIASKFIAVDAKRWKTIVDYAKNMRKQNQ